MLSLVTAAALASAPCGLVERVGQPLPAPPAPPLAMGAEKLVRDAYEVPNVLTTPHFAVRWGDQVAVDPADVQALAVALEDVWRVEIEELGYPMPLTTAWYKLNVYVGDTGDGAPDSGGAAGFYWYDDEAYPMLVVSALAVDEPDQAAVVAAHELFHGVQAAAATYAFTEADFWYWEATATWISSQVFPDNPGYASLLFGQAYLPHLPIHGYFYGSGGIAEFHPYGAFLFVTWLAEIGGDPALVRRSWLEAPVGGDPIAVIEGLLAPDWALRDAFFDFARRNAVWDYADGPVYAASVAASGGWEHPDSARPSGTLDGPGAIEAAAPLPHTLGASYWRVDLPGGAEVAFDGDPGPDWDVTVVGAAEGGPVYLEVPLADGAGAVVLPDTDAWTEGWLVVAAFDGTTPAGPVGGYRLAVEVPEEGAPDDTGPAEDTADPVVHDPMPEPVPAAGCCCAAPLGSLGLAMWGLVALVTARRRRPA